MQMANTHLKRSSAWLIIKKHKSKLQWGITSHESELPASQNLWTEYSGDDVEKRELSYPVGVNISWYSHYRQYGDFLKNEE